jgi:hypothetical protein
MKVHLHIGMSKAGSTAIQRCLAQHEAAMLEVGTCFPKARRERKAHYELFIRLRDGEFDAARETMRAMLDEASRARARAVIVSVEGLWLLPDAAVAELAAMLRDHEVEVVLYLRRPDTYITSSYRQRVKRKRGTKSERAYAAEPLPRLRYDRVLSRWAAHFALRARAYERVSADLVGDFAHATGLVGVLDCPARRRANVTPSDGALRLMRLSNRLLRYRVGSAVNRRLLAWQHLLAWLPPLDDAPLVARARDEAGQWDRAVMARHLSPEDLTAITPPPQENG